jgi:RNA 2',3'-cyclic 3'-phosphodiesterase
MSEHWRCFVAAPIGEELRAALAASVVAWRVRPELAGLRWTEPGSWHLTLAFLGSVEVDAVPRIAEAVSDVAARSEPMSLAGGELGVFPSPGRATVAWYGIVDSDGILHGLSRDLRSALGLDDAQPFQPHVTIARARGRSVDLRSFLAGESGPPMTFRTDCIELMRSHLGRGPARYEVIESAVLEGPAHV